MKCIHGVLPTVVCPACDECRECSGLRVWTIHQPGMYCSGWTWVPGAMRHLDFNAERDNVSWRQRGTD